MTGIKLLFALTILIAFGTSIEAEAKDKANKTNGNFMTEFGETLPPIGHVRFCRTHPDECRRVTSASGGVTTLDRRAWNELNLVNRAVNERIAPVTDDALYAMQEHWAYPVAQGDCEDYVLLKRLMLINRGWSEDTLLITVVREQSGEGHAVLTVRTDRGDLILDNQAANIEPWYRTPYRYLKRQSQKHAGKWIALDPSVRDKGIRLFSALGG